MHPTEFLFPIPFLVRYFTVCQLLYTRMPTLQQMLQQIPSCRGTVDLLKDPFSMTVLCTVCSIGKQSLQKGRHIKSNRSNADTAVCRPLLNSAKVDSRHPSPHCHPRAWCLLLFSASVVRVLHLPILFLYEFPLPSESLISSCLTLFCVTRLCLIFWLAFSFLFTSLPVQLDIHTFTHALRHCVTRCNDKV